MALSRRPLDNPAMIQPPTDLQAIGQRIIDLREALNLSQAEFARRIGEPPQKVLNWEKAKNRPTIDSAWEICRATGVTTDWIYSGDERGVAFDLMQRIHDLQEGRRDRKAG